MFHSAKLKIQWAEHHIRNFEEFLRLFIQNNPHGVRITENAESGQITANINFGEEPPVNFSLIISDVIHNLRTALDHANWELRGLDGGAQNRHTKLPVADNRTAYEGICGGIKTPTGDLPDFFKALEFFKDGKGHLIYALHDLDVEDKHMFLHVAISSMLVNLPKAESAVDFNIDLSDFRPNITAERKRQPLKVNQNPDTSLEICFGEVGAFKFKPVIPTLVHLRDAVKQVIGQFEALVAARRGYPIDLRGCQ